MRFVSLIRYATFMLLILPLWSNAATIAAGQSHTCALTAAGGVQCWGDNGNGQLGTNTGILNSKVPVAVTGLSSGVQAIATGFNHSCALTTSGGVQCWGYNGYGQLGDATSSNRPAPVTVSGLGSGVQSIAAAGSQTCALTASGGVQCWGYNNYGQLGDGTTTNRLTPAAVSGLSSGVQAIAAGVYHTCALTTAGGVQCWGYNANGQLGDGSTTNRLTPVAVSGLSSGVQAIAAGGYHTCALLTSGTVQCWGGNWNGTLGNGTITSSNTPLTVSGLSGGVQALAAGLNHSCALTTSGGVQCWGNNASGQVGDGTTTNRLVPTAVSGLSGGVQSVATGQAHSCIMRASGSVQCWGSNSSGQLGDGTTTNRLTSVVAMKAVQSINVTTTAPALGVIGMSFPVAASSSSGLPVTIAASGGCSLSGNTVTMLSVTPFCTVTYTQAGNTEYAATTVSSITSVDTDGDGTPNAIDSDDDNDGALDIFDAMPLDASDSLDADYDGMGNAADSDDDNDTVLDGEDNCPLRANLNQLDSNANGIGDTCEPPALAAGYSHTCALRGAGEVECWGSNSYGQLGDGSTTPRLTPVFVSGLSGGVQSIAGGGGHTCALTAGGGVQCWGNNASGQVGDGSPTDRRLSPVPVSGLSSGVQSIAAGSSHTCALTTAGGVQCWGYNYAGQLGDGTYTNRLTPVAVSGLNSGVQAIATGASHTCALTVAGGVQCWGNNQYGQLGDGTISNYRFTPVAVSGLSSGVQAITAGWDHTCALTTAGAVKCWGVNNNQQLGDGTTTYRLIPVAVSGLNSGVEAIAAGGYHTCALTAAGGVQCWGKNASGQVGDGSTTGRSSPVAVNGLNSGVQAIATGQYHTCALTTAGDVKCWGSNSDGQLGDGTTANSLTPVELIVWGQIITTTAPALGVIGVGFPVVASSSSGLPVTITTSGGCSISGNTVTITSATVFCTITYTQAGNENYSAALTTSVTSVDTDGDGMPDALDTDDDNDGVLDSFDALPLDTSDWLDADYDGIGNITDADDDNDTVLDGSDNCPLRANPNQLDSIANGIGDACEPPAIAAGDDRTCGLTSMGGAQCWGDNLNGQLGDGSTTDRLTPVAVSGLSSGVQSIITSRYHSCALTTAGGVLCWGASSGGLGNGSTATQLTPFAVTGLSSGVQAITAGINHTCALTTAGGVQCWGSGSSGQLGDGTTTDRLTPVAVSGLNTGVQAIAAGSSHTCALTTAGGVQCWGNNQYGQLGDGSTTRQFTPVAVSGLNSGVQAITAGQNHTCALTTAGGVQCWGYNGYGELGDGTTTNRLAPVAVSGLSNGVQAITAGHYYTCALTMSGSVQCWGNNGYGQLGDGTTTSRLTPGLVSGLSSGVQVIAAGFTHSCALLTSGRVQCWGNNSDGQLGDGSKTSRSIPIDVLRDGDGDGVLDAADAFPYNAAESIDTDHDGIGNNADTDDDGDGVPDYIDADPLNAAVNTERLLPLNSGFKGSSVQESAAPL